MHTPFFVIAEIWIVKHYPPTLEFSYTNKISNHFDWENVVILKTFLIILTGNLKPLPMHQQKIHSSTITVGKSLYHPSNFRFST